MDNPTRKSEADSVAEIVKAGLTPIKAEIASVAPLFLWPKSERVESLERFMERPARKRVNVVVHDPESFVAYVKAHKEDGTTVFATLTETGGSFTAVIDYHLAKGQTLDSEPRWCDHSCTLLLQYSPEWTRWSKASGKPMDQMTFANFLEDNRLEIENPDAASIIEIAKAIEASIGSQFKSTIRLDNGDRSLLYETQTMASARKGELQIPDKITLVLPIFVGTDQTTIDAWFRFTLNSGDLKLRYELIRPHIAINQILRAVRDSISADLGLKVLAGSASSPNQPR